MGQGASVALRGDGHTAIIGGWRDNGYMGAAWAFSDQQNGIPDVEPAGVGTFRPGQNSPNPFNPGTTIRCNLPERSRVTLSVSDPLGRLVVTLVEREAQPGEHTAWIDGSRLASGVYFYRLQAGSYVRTMRLLLLK